MAKVAERKSQEKAPQASQVEAPSIEIRANETEEAPIEQPVMLAQEERRLEEAPMQVPPSEEDVAIAEEAGIAAWHNGKKITALWCSSSPRNSWIAVSGLGWRRLANRNDSSVVSMTMLAAHAEQTNSTCNIRIHTDGLVHEIYVW